MGTLFQRHNYSRPRAVCSSAGRAPGRTAPRGRRGGNDDKITSIVTTACENMEQVLRSKLKAEVLQVTDESAEHAGHPGARGGRHYQVLIVSPLFDGRTALERHKLVYAALGNLMQTQIHALKLKTLTFEEWNNKRSSRA